MPSRLALARGFCVLLLAHGARGLVTAGALEDAKAPEAPAPAGRRAAQAPARVLTNADLERAPAPAATRRVYTNEDLDRLHELRAETGVLSRPAVPERQGDDGGEKQRASAERTWRREAARVRAKLARLAEQADAVRERIATAESRAARSEGRRGGSRPADTAPQRARLLAIEERMRQLERDLEDRARREGALPGWLR